MFTMRPHKFVPFPLEGNPSSLFPSPLEGEGQGGGGIFGFTLIELLIVLTIIGLLASYAIPKYLDISTQAKISVCKGALAHVRASLLLHNYEARIKGTNTWPSLNQVQDNGTNAGSKIMQYGDLPNNPFSTGVQRDAVMAVGEKPTPEGTQGAWAYNPQTGQFWANTDSGNDEVNF